ncbi:MAG: Uma2 family endonuclease [Luteitalea sp.]|nr:Uma2 family endonuclease [Luteitalea sp.]
MDGKGLRRRATYDDLLQVPDHLVAEIIDGVLYTSPRPAFRHSRAGSKLGMDLAPFDESGGELGGWWILDEPELHFGSDVVVPDLAGWRVERMPELPDVTFSTLAPDWVCEVLSPSTARLDRDKKLGVDGRVHVRHLWLLDPIAKTLEVLVLVGSRWTLQTTYRDNERVRAVPFDAIEIEMAGLWAEARTTPARR